MQTELELKGIPNTVTNISWNPDGKSIAVNENKSIKIIDIITGKKICMLQGHTHEVIDISYSPDGKQIVSCSEDQTIKLWDVFTGKEILTMRGHTHDVVTVCFSPDGKYIASGSVDKTGKVWENGKDILTIKHETFIGSINFSLDSHKIATSDFLNNIKINSIPPV